MSICVRMYIFRQVYKGIYHVVYLLTHSEALSLKKSLRINNPYISSIFYVFL